MSTNSTPKRIDQQVADQALIDGLTKHASVLPTLVIDGVTHTPPDLVTTLQARIAARSNVATTRAPWQAAVKADLDERTKTQALIAGLRQVIRAAFATQITVLADFALTPRKVPAPRTPAQKAASVAKARATRAARHTMGSVQRSQITGAAPVAAPVTAPPVTPPAAPPVPATLPASAAPAAAAPLPKP